MGDWIRLYVICCSCVFDGNACGKDDFLGFQTDAGLCYIFNPNGDRISTKPGIDETTTARFLIDQINCSCILNNWNSIYHRVHTIHYSCILYNWNKLFLRDMCIPRSGVALAVCSMKRYCYSFPFGYKRVLQLYSSWFSISWYGYSYRVIVHWSSAPHHNPQDCFLAVRCFRVECHYAFLLVIPR